MLIESIGVSGKKGCRSAGSLFMKADMASAKLKL
jgi:hypothetical protein